jgi:hypothetical protein
MRRPVGVKWVLLFFRWTSFSPAELATVAILPCACLRRIVDRSDGLQNKTHRYKVDFNQHVLRSRTNILCVSRFSAGF